MWSLKSLALLKCEGRTSLYAVQYVTARLFCFVLISLRIAINVLFYETASLAFSNCS